MSTSTAHLKPIFLFADLDEQELHNIAAIAYSRQYRSKSVVFMEGEQREAVFFIQSGVVKVSKIDVNGNETIVNFLKAGEMFPHAGFFENAPYPGTAEAVLDSELTVVPVKAFEQLLMNHPSIAIKVMRMMGRKIRELQSKLQDLTRLDLYFRISAVLLRLMEDHGMQTEDGIKLSVQVTNADLANMAGTTRETVNRFLNKLKKDGVLTVLQRQLIILDREALMSYIEDSQTS